MSDVLNALFQSIAPLWEMSVTAAYVSAIIIVLRLVLKKRIPKQVMCLLWLVVFVRLLIPVSLESPLSIVPGALPGYEQAQSPDKTPVTPADINPGVPDQSQISVQAPDQNQAAGSAAVPVNNNPAAPALSVPEGVTPSAAPEASASFPWRAAIAGVWLAGAAAMGVYALISYLRLRRRLFDAIRAGDGAWEHPAVDSPFILGVLRPRIYLPAGLEGRPRKFILCHERAHLRRLDHIVKPVCWIALALHWFNPFVWAAFLLMSRDIESACDEAVVRRLGSEIKADYSATLLALATGRRVPSPCPLAFDEGDAKGRIQNVLRYRRPALWVIVVSAVLAVVTAVCLLTDPVSAEGPEPEGDPDPDPAVTASQPPASQAPAAGTDVSSLLAPWMKEVLDGERTFRAGYNEELEFPISQIGAFFYGEVYNTTVKPGRLAIIDLDRDGVNEMVIWPEGDDEYLYSVVGLLVLRRQGDDVYGYNPGYRSFYILKADGTFHWSSGASNNGTGRAQFTENGFEVQEITWCEPSGIDELYFVDGRKATREEYDAANAAQSAKPDVTWYTYNDGILSLYLPEDIELVSATTDDSNGPKLWLEGGETPWLEWNGTASPLDGPVTPAQSPDIRCRDFDGDGQDEIVFSYYINGFLQLDLYEWNGSQPVLAASYDTQQLLVRFNQNNVAAYNKDTRGLTVTYSHETGPDSSHDVTGHAVLPTDFFDGGYERFRDDTRGVYADAFHMIYLREDLNAYYLDFEFYLADETMRELDYVETLSAEPPYSQYADHYMFSSPVGGTGFLLSYDGEGWTLTEADELMMDYQDEEDQPPVSVMSPLGNLDYTLITSREDISDDPEHWSLVAELPDDMIWLFTRNHGSEVLMQWDGNFHQLFSHTAYTPRGIMPEMKKLGPDDNLHYGPIAVISQVGSGTGVSAYELVVYDLDATPGAVDYVHDWNPLRDDFNQNIVFQYDKNAHALTYTYQNQTVEAVVDADDSTYRRIEQEGVTLRVTGNNVAYWFDRVNDGDIKIELTIEVFVGDDVVPLIVPGWVQWTLRFNGSGFDTVPGSCELTYPGSTYQ